MSGIKLFVAFCAGTVFMWMSPAVATADVTNACQGSTAAWCTPAPTSSSESVVAPAAVPATAAPSSAVDDACKDSKAPWCPTPTPTPSTSAGTTSPVATVTPVPAPTLSTPAPPVTPTPSASPTAKKPKNSGTPTTVVTPKPLKTPELPEAETPKVDVDTKLPAPPKPKADMPKKPESKQPVVDPEGSGPASAFVPDMATQAEEFDDTVVLEQSGKSVQGFSWMFVSALLLLATGAAILYLATRKPPSEQTEETSEAPVSAEESEEASV